MNLSKLQSEAVKEFDYKFSVSYDVPEIQFFRWADNDDNYPVRIKQFLSDQIQKAVDETRKEDIEIIKRHRPVFFKGDLHSLLSKDEVMVVREVLRIEMLEELGIDCSKMRLSIQSKGK
jgi:hypothetical protein